MKTGMPDKGVSIMGAEYRQRYEDHLLRITVLAATHQITVVFAAMAAD